MFKVDGQSHDGKSEPPWCMILLQLKDPADDNWRCQKHCGKWPVISSGGLYSKVYIPRWPFGFSSIGLQIIGVMFTRLMFYRFESWLSTFSRLYRQVKHARTVHLVKVWSGEMTCSGPIWKYISLTSYCKKKLLITWHYTRNFFHVTSPRSRDALYRWKSGINKFRFGWMILIWTFSTWFYAKKFKTNETLSPN